MIVFFNNGKEEDVIELDEVSTKIKQDTIQYKVNSKNTPSLFVSFTKPKGEDTIQDLDFSKNITSEREDLEKEIYELLDKYTEDIRSGIEPESENVDQDTKDPYNPKDISIRNDRWQISYLYDLMSKYNEIDLSPDYQRQFIWDHKRQCRLIESLMLKIPIPTFYLAENEEGTYHVVDGLQRLSSIKKFLDNQLKLKYLEYLSDQENRFYQTKDNKNGIDRQYERNILQTQVTVNIIEARSPFKVKYDVFRRLNTGGKALNSQEIRNSLCLKHTRKLISELAYSKEFKEATMNSVKSNRMESHELVLRFIAFWLEKILNDKDWEYTGNMQNFLDDTIQNLNTNKELDLEKIKKDFLNSMNLSKFLFGKYAFRKCLPEHLKEKAKVQLINKSLFTTLSVILIPYSYEKIIKKACFYSVVRHLRVVLANKKVGFFLKK